MNRLHRLHYLAMLSAFMALFTTSCGSLHADYVLADEETYEYAQPKLEEWAEATGDPEWVGIVDEKGVAWKARVKRAKAKLAEDGADE